MQVDEDKAILSGQQISEYLLCRSAEQRFSNWESTVSKIALQTDNTFPAKGLLVELVNDGTHKIADGSKLPDDIGPFALSVIWRASVSTKFPDVTLGDRYNEVFRQYLLGNTGAPRSVRLLVHILDIASGPRADRYVIQPESRRSGAHHVHQFAVFGFHFFIVVGNRTPTIYDRVDFLSKKRVLVSNGESVLRSVSTVAKARPRKGKLAQLFPR
ncbi:hypothetical protein WME88_34355 [Sorangium sp. So ce216]